MLYGDPFSELYINAGSDWCYLTTSVNCGSVNMLLDPGILQNSEVRPNLNVYSKDYHDATWIKNSAKIIYSMYRGSVEICTRAYYISQFKLL